MNGFQDFTSLVRDNYGIVSLLAGSAVKTTALLSFVLVLCSVLRRRHAETRHLLWTLALCSSLALPLLSPTLNLWQVPILPESVAVTRYMTEPSPTNGVGGRQRPPRTRRENSHVFSYEADEDQSSQFVAAPPPSATFSRRSERQAEPSQVPAMPRIPHWTTLVLAVWLTGASSLLVRLLVGIIGTVLLARRAAEFGDSEWTKLFSALLVDLKLTGKVRLLRSERTLMPIVCGALRPAVVLPASADEWSEERRRVVLLHELAHVARRDCLTQVLTQVTCALYWFNPLVWHAARQSRIERERACDDYVLSVGAKPSDYAHHLLEIARSLRSRPTVEVSAIASVAMARRSQLENRLLAILEKDVNSQATPRAITVGVTALLCFAVLTIAAVRPVARAARNIPNATAASDARRQATGNSSSAPASASGSATQEGERRASEQEQKRNDEDDKEDDDSTVTPSIEADVERDVEQDVEPDIEQDVAEDTARGRLAARVQAPVVDVNPRIDIHLNPDFKFDFNYEQEDTSERKGQSPDYIEELASVGYRNLSIEQLIQLKTHGVTADYVKSLRAIGFDNLSVAQLAAMRIHGVTPAYVEAMRAAGYSGLKPNELASFRIHGVTPEYIKAIRDAGYSNLPAKELLAFRIHGVTPEFIAGMRAAGYDNLSPHQLTSLRVMGVTPQFVRTARSRLGDLTVKQIIALKQTGIIKDSEDK